MLNEHRINKGINRLNICVKDPCQRNSNVLNGMMTEMDSCELLCKISLRHTVAGSMQNMAILMQQQNVTSFIAHYGLHLPTVLMFSFFNIDRFQKHINAIHWNAFKKT